MIQPSPGIFFPLLLPNDEFEAPLINSIAASAYSTKKVSLERPRIAARRLINARDPQNSDAQRWIGAPEAHEIGILKVGLIDVAKDWAHRVR
jgi:hypothetical protein